MKEELTTLENTISKEYQYGFSTDIATEVIPKGLSEPVIRLLSAKKNEPEWMLEWRLKAYRHWLTMEEPKWPNVSYPEINYQDIIYYAAPKIREN
jgi:Fe-S cluster assembly protein SufB